MDYRPIALLQTGYTVFSKFFAKRIQRFLGTLIGDSQQGCVHGRQMHKTVMMMMGVLHSASAQPAVPVENSAAILILKFRKSYDTVDRDFLFLALSRLNFRRSLLR
uniref:Reverse transcriptase domain-containing protein n=1 Tax=Peronospora matthiolae TaxID=2874970 RepID=A0AAV1V103_9STRA